MSETDLERPPQVGLAGWMIVLGSAFTVFTAWDTVSRLHTLDTRETVEKALADAPASGWNITTENVLQIMQYSSMVAAGCATACLILGIHALRRNTQARLALSVLAVPLFLTGLVAGGFTAALVSVSVLTLWLQPARDWFAGRKPSQAADRPDQPSRMDRWQAGQDARSDRSSPTVGQQQAQGPRPMRGFGDPAGTPSGPSAGNTPPGSPQPSTPQPGAPHPGATHHDSGPQNAPAAWGTPYGHPGAGQPSAGHPGQQPAPRRPGEVVTACLVTWSLSGLVLIFLALTGLSLAVIDGATLDQIRRDNPQLQEAGLSSDQLIGYTTAMVVILSIWALAACALAALVWRGSGWARILLVVSAGLAAGFTAIAGTMTILPWLCTVACGATMVLLLRAPAAAWTRRHTETKGHRP